MTYKRKHSFNVPCFSVQLTSFSNISILSSYRMLHFTNSILVGLVINCTGTVVVVVHTEEAVGGRSKI